MHLLAYYVYMSSSGGPTWDVPRGRKDGRISRNHAMTSSHL